MSTVYNMICVGDWCFG